VSGPSLPRSRWPGHRRAHLAGGVYQLFDPADPLFPVASGAWLESWGSDGGARALVRSSNRHPPTKSQPSPVGNGRGGVPPPAVVENASQRPTPRPMTPRLSTSNPLPAGAIRHGTGSAHPGATTTVGGPAHSSRLSRSRLRRRQLRPGMGTRSRTVRRIKIASLTAQDLCFKCGDEGRWLLAALTSRA
jgi:hypothetical protein